MNPLKKGIEEELENKGKEIIRNLENKTKKIKENLESNQRAEFIMRSLKRKAKGDYEMEDVTDEQINKALKNNDGKGMVIQREKKTKN